jgi:hypothetical protein
MGALRIPEDQRRDHHEQRLDHGRHGYAYERVQWRVVSVSVDESLSVGGFGSGGTGLRLFAAEGLRTPNAFDAFLDERLRVTRNRITTDVLALRGLLTGGSVLVMNSAERADLLPWHARQDPLAELTTRNDGLRSGISAATVLDVAATDAFERRAVGEERGTLRWALQGSAGAGD